MKKMVPKKHPPNLIRKLREDRRMSQADLGLKADTTRQQIHKLETGELSLSHSWMVRIAAALGVSEADLLPSKNASANENNTQEVVAPRHQPAVIYPGGAQSILGTRQDLPLRRIFRTTVGEGFLAELLGGTMVVRPSELEGVADSYAFYMPDHSMGTAIRMGNRCWVDPSKPYDETDEVFVRLKTDRIRIGYVKKLLKTGIILGQYRPANETLIPFDEIESVHLIVGNIRP